MDDLLVTPGFFNREDKLSRAAASRSLNGLHKVLYDAVGQLSSDLSEEAISTLCDDAKALELNSLTLRFRNQGIEAEFQHHVAVRRRPILILVFCFDVTCYLFRMASKFIKTGVSLHTLVKGMLPQICNTVFLYSFLWLLNRRSRCNGQAAAQQEELLLTGVMTLAICSLLITITATNPQDYVYAAMFMISTTCFLKIQWLVGTIFMILPLVVTRYWHSTSSVLPSDAETHLVVSWAVGGFMAYLSDTYRRQMFVNHRLARIAAGKELQEAQARINVQQQLATAQQQAAQRNITVAREKAANEAKSEFMSLMCHEVRTPLNGCLASAEMLLEMPLQEEQRELAKTIRVSGSILLSTVSNFLDFFKMEAGKQLDVVRTEMNTQDLVGDIHCIIEATIGRNAEVLLDKPNTDGVPKYVLGDPDRLRGILLNLYTNAAKFTKQGFISLRVRVAGHDYRPSPAQVKAQQQHGPRPMHSTALNRQSSEEASQQLLLKQHRVLFALDRSQNASASPFLSNALAIPHLSHTASAMRSQSMRDSQSPHSRQEQGKDVTAIGGAATSGHADAAAKMESPFDEAEAQAQTALLRGQKEHDVAHETMQDAQITTPAACEHIAGQVMLARTAQKISRAANLVRNGMSEGKQEADQMQDSEEHGLQDNESYHQHQAGNSPCGSQSHHSQEPLSSSHQSTQPQQSSTATTAATASAKAYDDTTSQLSTVAEELAGSQTLDAVKRDHSRQSSTCVLDDQPTSSSSSDDARQSATHYRPSTSNGHTQSAPTPYGHNSKHWHSADALPDAHVRTSPHQETNASTPRSSNIGDRSHSSTDLTEHGCQKSSGSFSDYPSPMRRSVSSPGLCEGSEDFFSESSKPNRPTSAVAYNGTASDKATLGGGIVTSIQDLGSGWHNTVAQRRPPRFSASERRNHADPPPAPANAPGDPTQSPFQAASAASAGGADSKEASCDEWLVFEVTDTGCGISKQGLASLFTEYVQGTEDDMKRPRSRGGTGLGLSICSKQVSVLGGLIGAMSKLGEGSTFWFTVPLLRPTNTARESLSMRRTASWGSRDAFTDGHISRHAAPREVPTGRRTLAATTRAHRSKRYHAKFPQRGEPRTSCSDPDADWELEHRRVCGAVNDAAARRRSAPEAPQSRGAHQDPQQLRPSVSDDSHLSEGGSSVQAKAAVARAVLCPQAFTHSSSNSMHSSGQQSHTPDQFRSHQNEDRSASELNADHEPQRDGQNGHASLSYTNIQRNLLMPYSASSQHDSLSRRPSLMALPEEAPVDYEDSRDNVQALADNNSSNSGQQRGNATGASSDAQRGMNIRPSMEARRRRLGSSALQGRSVLLAEDNLINQRVAKMMLCSLGMTVEVACNGQEAVQAVCRNAEAVRRNECRQFDVLLMDMAMPVMGGVDATKEIRRKGHAVPIVAMTANASDKDRDECLGAGMDGFLSKPVLKDRLAEAIMSAVSGRRQFRDSGTISLKAYDRL